jgi:hypothetical protein
MIKFNKKTSKQLEINKVVLQGCPLSPTPFNIYLDEIITKWQNKIYIYILSLKHIFSANHIYTIFNGNNKGVMNVTITLTLPFKLMISVCVCVCVCVHSSCAVNSCIKKVAPAVFKCLCVHCLQQVCNLILKVPLYWACATSVLCHIGLVQYRSCAIPVLGHIGVVPCWSCVISVLCHIGK